MKNTLKILTVLATSSIIANAGAFADVTYDSGSDTTTFLISNVSGTAATITGVINFVNLDPGGFTFNNSESAVVSTVDSSMMTTNTISQIQIWQGNGGAIPSGQLDGIQVIFDDAGSYAGTFEFSISGSEYSAFDGSMFSVPASATFFGASEITQVPEPTSSALLGLGALGLLARRKRG